MIEKAACFICAVPVYSRILAKYGGFRYDTGMSFVFPRDLHGFRIHMVGIKGTGMAALTEILCARGACVSGSDTADVFYTDEILNRLGIAPCLFSADNITGDIQCVIYSSAYSPETNPDLVEAFRRGLPCLLYSQALGIFSQTAFSCGICGVHGKTTTTGLAGTVCHALNLPAQTIAGSVISSFGGSCTQTDGHDFFIAETCEYQRHFMSFHPGKILLTSVESDHQDYYPTYESIRDAFIDYICLLPEGGELIYCADDSGACECAAAAHAKRPDIVLTAYGEKARGLYHVVFGGAADGKQYFSIDLFAGRQFALRMPGRHLVLNAAGATALACSLLSLSGRPVDSKAADCIERGLLAFSGGKRRSEIIGAVRSDACDVVFIDDYGHHPSAVRTTLEGYRKFYPGRKIITDFMAHTYSRTEALFEQFASCFGAADELILHKIYASARESAGNFTVSGRKLAEAAAHHHPHVRYYEEVMDAYSDIRNELLTPRAGGYLFVTMGAGDNWKLGQALYDSLK